MSDLLGVSLIAIGVLFDIFGCIGLLRLPDVYNRIQSSTKCVTVGTCFILVGSIVLLGSLSGAAKGVLCMALILVTSPTGAHALARAAYRSGIRLWDHSVEDDYKEEVHGSDGKELGS